MKIKFLLPLVFLGACTQNQPKMDEVESMKQQIDSTQIPMTVPDTTLPKGWDAVEFTTNYGVLTVGLNPATPQHSANFLKLAKSGYYNGVLFHRVIRNFMVQSGDPDSKTAKPGQQLGEGGPKTTIPAEINDTIYHFKGALAAARTSDDVNPMKRSSGSQFYIVTGSPSSPEKFKEFLEQKAIQDYLDNPANKEMAMRLATAQQIGNQAGVDQIIKEIKPLVKQAVLDKYNAIPQNVRNIYATWGGTPFLDKNYTVFGKLVKGYYVLDLIQQAKTDRGDRPSDDIRILSTKVIPANASR